jgi:hypothetical protein
MNFRFTVDFYPSENYPNPYLLNIQSLNEACRVFHIMLMSLLDLFVDSSISTSCQFE